MASSQHPDNFPSIWSHAWGQDQYGLWQRIRLNGVSQVMRWIPPGAFEMGSPKDEQDRRGNEVLHKVTITKGFWMADTACTQELWIAVMGQNPSHFTDSSQLPVEKISWDDCRDFVDKVNAMLRGQFVFNLPTEAQWEYACRAGTQTPFHFGESADANQANFNGGYPYGRGARGRNRKRTVDVLSFSPNPWGLYQMHGNVWEWCEDWFGDYPEAAVTDPEGPVEGRGRVLRGGSWFFDARGLRSARRDASAPGLRYHYIGFRLAGGDPLAGDSK